MTFTLEPVLDGVEHNLLFQTLDLVIWVNKHLLANFFVERIEPERLFSWRWHPYAVDPKKDYSNEPTTLVECALSDVSGGTQLKIVESGFDQIPLDRRAEAYRMNTGGWSQQLQNIARHLAERA